MNEILHSIRVEKESQSNLWKELVTVPSNRKRTAIAISLGLFSQWCGNGVVSYYLTLVLNNIGITNPTHQSLINGLLQVFNFGISVFMGAMMVDRLGRRVLFLWSATGMMLAYIVSLPESSPSPLRIDQLTTYRPGRLSAPAFSALIPSALALLWFQSFSSTTFTMISPLLRCFTLTPRRYSHSGFEALVSA